jgi:tetratricopeptide (TPR) repeat protein
MNFLKALFGGSETNPEEEKEQASKQHFELMKYDGVKAMKMGQWDYAERCFKEALKTADDLEIHDYLSRVYVRQDRLSEALAELQHLSDAEPQNIDIQLQMAHVSFMQEDYAAMATAAERAIAIDAQSATAYYFYAQAALGQNDLINGIARLTKAVALDEKKGDARLLRAQTLLKMGDVKGADEDCQWLLEHTEGQEDVLMLASQIARAKGDDAQAVEYLKKALELNPFLLDNVSGDFEAEGVEEQTKRAYSMMNPFGI